MVEVAALAGSLPPWVLPVIAVLVAVKYVGQALAESSEQWARVFGPLGRRWRGRAQRRTEAAEELRTAEAADLQALERQVGNLAREVERLTRKDEERGAFEDRLRAYLVYDADWHFRAQLAAASTGTTLPDHMSFIRWEARE